MRNQKIIIMLAVIACVFVMAGPASAVTLPDNGAGTLDLPIHYNYNAQSPMYITNGLPAGTNITIAAVHTAPTSTVEQPGGTLGGTQSAGIGSGFAWNMVGTGTLLGFNRTVFIPFSGAVASFPAPPGAGYEVHAAPRTPYAPVQSFNTDMYRMFGQIAGVGDPDFDLLRVTAGSDFGLPSPGQTTLTQVGGGNWAINSFFDVTYRIDFVGAPGGQLAGQSGSTTGTVRLAIVPEPTTLSLLGVGILGLLKKRRAV